PFERKERLTRALLEIFLETRHPVSVVTKSSLIVRDLDLWVRLAENRLAHVGISLTTLDGGLARQLEPRASAPQARLEAMRLLADAGVPVSAFVSPLIPGLNDRELEKLLAAARDHGATSAGYTLLRLPHEVAGLFREWLDAHAPEKASRIMSVLYDLRGGRANDPGFGSRMKGLGHYADLIRQRFELACRRLDFWTRPLSGHHRPRGRSTSGNCRCSEPGTPPATAPVWIDRPSPPRGPARTLAQVITGPRAVTAT
ncbi:MAG: radical SAM protein, partial [Thiobacillaceae bacterium]|nr:radical SAM protein [Thiobacillaceae bacterium]